MAARPRRCSNRITRCASPPSTMITSKTMARLALRLLGAFLVAVTALLLAGTVLAQGRVDFLAERLKFPPAAGQPDDFRVRTNAALALGRHQRRGRGAAPVRRPGDPSEVVRQAVAVALKELGRPSSLDCLKRHRASSPTQR